MDEDNESEMTQSTAPLLNTSQYNKYVVSLIKLLVGETTLNDWLRKGMKDKTSVIYLISHNLFS